MAKESKKTETKNTNGTKKRAKTKPSKRNITFYSIVGILGIVTLVFGFSVLNYFILEPGKSSGQPIYAYRTENLPVINEAEIASVESFGSGLSGVDSVEVTVQGPVIYFDVRVSASTELATAQELAEQMANKLIETVKIDEEGKTIHDFYELQLVVANEDPETLAETNRASEQEYIAQHELVIVQKAVDRAEQYPTADYIQRAYANLEMLDSESADYTTLKARIDALTELTAEQEEAMGEIPNIEIDTDVKPSELAEYPSWGTMNNAEGKFEWH
ncbi:MAG TPA: hypothetical protein DCY20_03070 [Firmicutes bacterium]|nr:hypothetical protein [Bacillota bacterium]